jgi:hypothetical protein
MDIIEDIKGLKWVLGLCLLLGVVFWVRYDSIIVLLISTVLSLATLLTVSRRISRVKTRNLTLGVISMALIMFMVVPIGGTDAAFEGSSLKMFVNSDNSISVYIQGQEMKFNTI